MDVRIEHLLINYSSFLSELNKLEWHIWFCYLLYAVPAVRKEDQNEVIVREEEEDDYDVNMEDLYRHWVGT